MLKQYQNPTFTVVFAEAADVLTLSLNTTDVEGLGSNNRTTFNFEGDIWTNN